MKAKRNFKIVILEDDDFYNKILTSFLRKNLQELGILRGFTVSITSYTSFVDCSMNLQPDMDIMITDYYLGYGYSAPLIMEKLRQKRIRCKVIVMSRLQTMQTAVSPLLDGAADFLKKNSNTLRECLHLSESILLDKMRTIH